jgi:endogenous inhibitor of DNA gyrase (YacG/DUF329 family)
MSEAKPQLQAPGRCPICGRPSRADYRPFCSRRCADVDLSRWLRGTYTIPGEPAPSDGEPHPTPKPGSEEG